MLRFFRLPAGEKTLVVQTVLLLCAIRLGLGLLPFARLRSILARLTVARAATRSPAIDGKRVIWAVEAVGRRLPGIGTCLTQALAAQVLLARHGHESNLRIGVTRNSDGKFLAHAWLEKDDVILIGGSSSDLFTPMPALNGLEP